MRLTTSCLLALCFVLSSAVLFADGEKKAAQLNKDFQEKFDQARTAFESSKPFLTPSAFRVVRDENNYFSNDTSKVYLQTTFMTSSTSLEELIPTVRKSVFKVLTMLDAKLSDVIGDDESQGIMLHFSIEHPQASTASMNSSEETLCICVSKYALKRFLDGALTTRDLLSQSRCMMMKEGKMSQGPSLI